MIGKKEDALKKVGCLKERSYLLELRALHSLLPSHLSVRLSIFPAGCLDFATGVEHSWHRQHIQNVNVKQSLSILSQVLA